MSDSGQADNILPVNLTVLVHRTMRYGIKYLCRVSCALTLHVLEIQRVTRTVWVLSQQYTQCADLLKSNSFNLQAQQRVFQAYLGRIRLNCQTAEVQSFMMMPRLSIAFINSATTRHCRSFHNRSGLHTSSTRFPLHLLCV